MYQVAIGDSLAGFTVIEGASISAPCFKAVIYFTFSADPFVTESIEIQLKGTSAQIKAFSALLETMAINANDHLMGSYPVPQQLRFQPLFAGPYYYTPISKIYLQANPAGYIHQSTGSKLVTLHYTRPNHFDGARTELPLSGRAGADVSGGYSLLNHTDSGANHGSSVLIKKADIVTDLPAPLRIEYAPTSAGLFYRNLMFGLYHHPTADSDLAFFKYYSDLTGGSNVADAGAIEGNFKRVTWTLGAYNGIYSFVISAAHLAQLFGFSYRPMLRLFSTHAYTDLYFKVAIEHGGYSLYTSDPVHSPPAVGYVNLPPLDLPPNFLLREVDPAQLSVVIYAWRESGAATTVEVDCITLFPMASAATFYAYFYIGNTQLFIDDSSLQRHNFRTSAAAGESMGHARVGGPLLIPPGQNSRLFIYASNNANLMPPALTATLRVFYYPRVRLL